MLTHKSSECILQWMNDYYRSNKSGFNASIILIHAVTGPRRTDKFYNRLSEVISLSKKEGYRFLRIDELLR